MFHTFECIKRDNHPLPVVISKIQLKYPKGIDEHGSRSYKERIGTLVGSSSPSRSGSPSRSAKGTNRTVVSGDRAITPNATSIRSTLLNAEQQEASGNEPTPVDFDRDAVPPSLRLGDELADACILAAVNKRMTRDTERRQHARKVKRLNRFAFQKPKPTAAAAAASSQDTTASILDENGPTPLLPAVKIK